MQNNENVKIKAMYREERPYEKCEQYGAENLTDAELLAVLLRTGTKGENSLRLAQKILHPETDRGGLVNLPQWTVEQLRQVRGIGKVKAIQIRCLAELARRMAKAEALEGLEKISEANKQKVHIARSKSGIVVKGINDMAVRFSKCCNPVPGDEIVGFVTRGRGMSIHRTDCVNVINLSAAERSRLITAEWEDPGDTEEGGQYLAELKLYADDRRGLLLDITKVFTEEKIDVKSMNTRTSKKGTATMDMGFIVHGREELNRVIKKLRQIENVIDIERTTG